jgi:hypothetical protein
MGGREAECNEIPSWREGDAGPRKHLVIERLSELGLMSLIASNIINQQITK